MNATQSTTARTCEFCGLPLKAIEVTIFGNTTEKTCYGSCGCERSAEMLGGSWRSSQPTGHRCPMCGGSMVLPDWPGYVSECHWCGYEVVFKSDLDAHGDSVARSRRGTLDGTGIPALYATAQADHATADRIIETGKGLFITGGSGTTKSLTAASVAKAFAEKGMSVRFVSSVSLLAEFRDTYGTSKSEADVFSELNGCDLLVIDDLGKENDTSWASSMLYAVVDGRYVSMKPVVVTTNYTEGELVAKMAREFDDKTARAMMSRLCEMTERVVIDGPDRRLS